MGKIRNVTLWLMAVVTLMGCAASRKTVTGSHEERGDSTVAVVTDSVRKSDVKTDSTVYLTTDESHASGTMSEKGRGEETITERVTESVDTNGNKTTTTDRTIHRKGDYERNVTYEERLKHQEETISRMQHTIDSLALGNSLNVGTHWVKKDSTNIVNETNTKEIKPESNSNFIPICFFWIVIIGIVTWLYNKR